MKEETLLEQKEERTEDSTTYERADGRKTTLFYGEAIRFKDPKKNLLTTMRPYKKWKAKRPNREQN